MQNKQVTGASALGVLGSAILGVVLAGIALDGFGVMFRGIVGMIGG